MSHTKAKKIHGYQYENSNIALAHRVRTHTEAAPPRTPPLACCAAGTRDHTRTACDSAKLKRNDTDHLMKFIFSQQFHCPQKDQMKREHKRQITL